MQEKRRKVKTAQKANETLDQLKEQNRQLAAEVGLLKETVHRGRNYLTAIAIIGKTIPDDIMVSEMQTFEGEGRSDRSRYRTVAPQVQKYGLKKQEVKLPPEPAILISGKAREDLTPKQKGEAVDNWAATFEEQSGLRGEKVFGKARILKNIAEGEDHGFIIRVPLLKAQQPAAPATQRDFPETNG